MKNNKKFMDIFSIITQIVILVVLILFAYFFISYGTKQTNINTPLPDNIAHTGFSVPINMSLLKLKSLNWGVGKNNIKSTIKFVLYDDHITTKFLFSKNTTFEKIESVDVSNLFNYQILYITFKDSELTYGAVLASDEYTKSVIKYFDDHKVPLTDNAKVLLK